jgi:uncharacterized SAM-binding protein YcdF (DUF218 family)
MQWFRNSRFHLLKRQNVWWPTSIGWFGIVLALGILLIWTFVAGETFLSLTNPLPEPDILIVEGWIGSEGVRAAAAEFQQHGYRYIATSGGPSLGRWEKTHSTYAEMAGLGLTESGIPPERIIVAPCKRAESGRTFESAVAVLHALRAKDLKPHAVNVFTYGPHARRSRLVFEKVFPNDARVGVIAWQPHDDSSEPWWRSSRRAKQLLSESIGYIFELLLNSARLTNAARAN